MDKKRIVYRELARATTTKSRQAVISKVTGCGNGYTIGQRVEVPEENVAVFLKGGIHIDDLAGMYNLRDALNVAIHKEENEVE